MNSNCDTHTSIRDCLKHDVFETIHKDTVFERDNKLYQYMRNHISDFVQNSIKEHKHKKKLFALYYTLTVIFNFVK